MQNQSTQRQATTVAHLSETHIAEAELELAKLRLRNSDGRFNLQVAAAERNLKLLKLFLA